MSANVSLPTVGVSVVLALALIYGFAPGAFLRLIVLAFHRDDPRRRELLAELRAVPRWERPMWVFEQLEVALFEGIFERIQWAATGRIIHRWRLGSGVVRHAADPTFWIPDDADKADVRPGIAVKLPFVMRDGWAEMMWVVVIQVHKRYLVGRLLNTPVGIPRLDRGHLVAFRPDAIIDIDWHGEAIKDTPAAEEDVVMCCPECTPHIEDLVPRLGRRRSWPAPSVDSRVHRQDELVEGDDAA
jgi:hypothetical protein